MDSAPGVCCQSAVPGWHDGGGKPSHAAWSVPMPHTCSGCCCLTWIWPGLSHHPAAQPQCSLCRAWQSASLLWLLLLPCQTSAPGTLSVPSVLCFLGGVVAEAPWLPSHLPVRNQGGGKEQAHFFDIYNQAQECFCFMATVIAH